MRTIISMASIIFKEAIRSKIIYLVLFFVLLLMTFASIFGSVSIGEQDKVIKDFGLFGISFFTVVYVILYGSIQLFKEVSKKTIYNILSKPVSRSSFLLGKFLGITSVVTLLSFLLTVILSFLCALLGYGFCNELYIAFVSILLQSLIISALVVLVSSVIINPILSGSLTFVLFLAGRSSDYIWQFIQVNSDGYLKFLYKIIYYIIPDLKKLDLTNHVVYNMEILNSFWLYSLEYTLGYVFIALSLAIIFFQKKELL